jgi:formate-dependent phosphoribosylglycinamide formyltransferase (GAR transformylase)
LLQSIGALLKNQHAFLFPLDDKAVWLSSKLALEQPWVLAGPQDGAAELALNKDLQCQAASQAGFSVPEGCLCKSADEVLNFVKSASFPVIMKAAEAVPVQSGRVLGCPKWICANQQELDRAIKQWAERVPILIQKFVTGTGEGLFGIAAPEGVRAWSAHRRLRMMNPQGSGSSACISQSVSDDLKQKAQRLIDVTGWHGLFMIELLRDQSGRLWFVEFNGRPWGSIALARKQKLEYPAWQLRLLTNSQSSVGMESSAVPGIVCRNAGREFMHILFVIKGSKSKALVGWPPIGATLRQVLAVRRGDTFYNWRRGDLKVFFADFYNTVQQNVFKHRH